jgi:hypothetical protein
LEVEAVNMLSQVLKYTKLPLKNDKAKFVVDKIKKLLTVKTHQDIEGDIIFENQY